MKKILRTIFNYTDYFFALFNHKPLTEKDGYFLYVRVYYRYGRIIDFLSYPVGIARDSIENGLIKKIRPLSDKEKADAIRKEYKK